MEAGDIRTEWDLPFNADNELMYLKTPFHVVIIISIHTM